MSIDNWVLAVGLTGMVALIAVIGAIIWYQELKDEREFQKTLNNIITEDVNRSNDK